MLQIVSHLIETVHGRRVPLNSRAGSVGHVGRGICAILQFLVLRAGTHLADEEAMMQK
jgi:hypothetical protein